MNILRFLFNYLMGENEILGFIILPLVLPTIVFCSPIIVRFIKNLKCDDKQNCRSTTKCCCVAAVMALLHVAFLLIIVLSWTNILPWATYFAFLGEFGFVAMFIGVLLGTLASIAGIVVAVQFFVKGCPAESKAPEWMYVSGMVVVSIVSGLPYVLAFPVMQGTILYFRKLDSDCG